MKRTAIAAILAVVLVTLIALPGCRERTIFNTVEAVDWLLLVEDPDEVNVAYNGHFLFVNIQDLAAGNLTFKVETYASIPNPASDVIMGIYLDTDQSSGTGLSTSAGWDASVTPNDIGADYMMLVGTEPSSGNSNELDQWNAGAWERVCSITVSSYADSLIGTIPLDSIGVSTGSIDIVAILICNPGTSELRDKMPDDNDGHVSVSIPGLQVVQTYDPRVVQEIDHQGKHISLITGKEINLEVQ